jgi:hypothetical protein
MTLKISVGGGAARVRLSFFGLMCYICFVSVRGYTTAVVQNRLGIVKRFSLGSDKNCKYYNGGTTLFTSYVNPFRFQNFVGTVL